MKYISKYLIQTLVFILFILSICFYSSASVSCSKNVDPPLNQRIPNIINFINNKVIFYVNVDSEYTLQNPEFNNVDLLYTLNNQTHLIIKFNYIDSITGITNDTIVKLDLVNIPGRLDIKMSDTLILKPRTSYSVLKIKTIDTLSKSTDFTIPDKQANLKLTTYNVPDVKFTIPTALNPLVYYLQTTYIGKNKSTFFGYGVTDFNLNVLFE